MFVCMCLCVCVCVVGCSFLAACVQHVYVKYNVQISFETSFKLSFYRFVSQALYISMDVLLHLALF